MMVSSMIHNVILVSLFFVSVPIFADWERVPLNDKSSFDVNCEYRAELNFKSSLGVSKTDFSIVSSKSLGYAHDSSGKFNAQVMFDNKTVLRFETESGTFIKEWRILGLWKNCQTYASKHDDKQKNNMTKEIIKEPAKDSTEFGADGIHFK
jgi:hypothetical protein